ncbi:MAG: hypothetical protein KDI55_24955 [Anaerolineae bacterium]|nr:hypothetical protein [Anaerolineae bacterium]
MNFAILDRMPMPSTSSGGPGSASSGSRWLRPMPVLVPHDVAAVGHAGGITASLDTVPARSATIRSGYNHDDHGVVALIPTGETQAAA